MKNNKYQSSLWIAWPFKFGRISAKLTDILLDGYYLIAFNPHQIYLQGIVLIAGLLIGALHSGFLTVFTESLLLVIGFGMIGVLSARLGFLLFVSFVIGDLLHALLYPIPSASLFSYVYSTFLINIIEYYLLFIWCVYLPITVKQWLALTIPYHKLSRKQLLYVIYSLHAIFTGLIAYFWITITPILIRAVLLAKGVTLTSGYAATLQVKGSTIVAWMIIASVARVYIQNKIVFDKKYATLLEEFESEVKQHKAQKDILTISRLPWIERALALTGFQLFILQGMLTNPIEYIAIGFSIFLTVAAQNGKIKIELGKLTEDIKKIQPLYRLIGFVVATFVLNSTINKIYYYSTPLQTIFFPYSTFFPVVLSVILTLIMYIILFPYTKPDHEEH